jgi:hypothetical protein
MTFRKAHAGGQRFSPMAAGRKHALLARPRQRNGSIDRKLLKSRLSPEVFS